MSEQDLYFNGRLWRGILKDEQAVRFLEELWRRAGGSEAPTYTLEETVTQITNIDSSTTETTFGMDRQRRQIGELLNQVLEDNQQLRAQLKRLESGINGAANHAGQDDQQLDARLKKLESRINDLENHQ